MKTAVYGLTAVLLVGLLVPEESYAFGRKKRKLRQIWSAPITLSDPIPEPIPEPTPEFTPIYGEPISDPTPEPAPEPSLPPIPPPAQWEPFPQTHSSIDAIDLHAVDVVKGVSIADWEVTSNVLSARMTDDEICIEHTKAGQWPMLPFFDYADATVEGNQWMFARIDGKWVGGAGEWLRPGQTCKAISAIRNIGADVYYNAPPLRDWIPRSNEIIGLAVSTPARAGQWGGAERSNIIFFRIP